MRFADEIETFNNVYYRLKMKEYDETCYICVKIQLNNKQKNLGRFALIVEKN